MSQENPKAVLVTKKFDLKNDSSFFIDSDLLAPLDVEKVAQYYDIDRTATALGKQELPNTDDPIRIDQERQIEQIYQDTVTRYHNYVVSNIERFDNDFEKSKHEAESTFDSLDMLVAEYENKNFDIKTDYDKNLKKEREDFERAGAAYNAYVLENHLSNRPCKLRSISSKTVSILFLFVLVIIESLINANLFASNLDGGLFAGAFYAFLASLFNSAFCFLVGLLGLVYLVHYKFSKKLIGFLSIILFFCGTILIALIVAHYRDALQSVEEGAEILALNTFKDSPFELADIYSWFLFFLTLFVGFSSALDGFFYRESYPGYESKELSYRKALEQWDYFCKEIKEHQERVRDETLKVSIESIGKLDNDIIFLRNCFNPKQNLLIKYENSRLTAEKDVRSLIQRFRTKNMEARSTKAPSYFNEPIEELDISNIPDINTSSKTDGESVIEALEARLKLARNLKNQVQKEIYQCYEKYVEILNNDLGTS